MNDNFKIIIGASPTYFKEVADYNQPLYNFFKTYNLEELSLSCMEALLLKRATYDNNHSIIDKISKIQQQEVQWHVAQMFSYLKITKAEQKKIKEILKRYIDTSRSNIVKAFSMQTLADIAGRDMSIKSEVIGIIRKAAKNGSPAVISRGKKLLKKLSD